MNPQPKASNSERRAIDWAAIRARVEAAAKGGEATDASARDRAVLERRAREVAGRIAETPALLPDREVVVFTLGGQHFAVSADAVREALPRREVTPLPGLAGQVRGLTNVRGRVVPVLDLRPILDLPPLNEIEAQRFVLLTWQGTDFAVPVDEIVGARDITAGSTHREPAGLDAQFVQSVTADGLILLDIAAVVRALTLEDSPSR